MKLRYIGAHTAVDVPVNHFDALTVNQGEEADIPDNIATNLLEQQNAWEAVEGTSTAEEAPPATRRGGRSSASTDEPAVEPGTGPEGRGAAETKREEE